MQARATQQDDTDLPRAQAYMLVSTLLARPPSETLLLRIAGLRSDGTAWGEALGALAAGCVPVREAEREFNRLFIGVSRGELVPYASYYRTGFLHDRPLVELRAEMARLGIARSPEVREPDDHIAGVLEMMAGLIDGRFGAPTAPEGQRAFFERHLAGWVPQFFRDLERAEAARFYRPVGALGILLMEIEQSAFVMVN